MTRIAIIGAGITGLACAKTLKEAGFQPVLFDKGRGIGGRVATRRADNLHFDHGAPYIHTNDDNFSYVLRGLIDTGNADIWDDGTGRELIVGTPGMSSIPKGLAAGLDVRLGTQIIALRPNGSGWRLFYDNFYYDATHVVLTIPAPQIKGFLGENHSLVKLVSDVQMSPDLTLMVAISGNPLNTRPMPEGYSLVSILQECQKPFRPQSNTTAWVAHANKSFTQAHLEGDLPSIASKMLPFLCDHLNISNDCVTHSVAHRWLYSRVAKPLGEPFVRTPNAKLYLGGDWCIGSQVEDAWNSGAAIATDLIEQGL